MRPVLRALLTAPLLLLALPIPAGQVHSEDVQLSELVEMAMAIAVVRPATPATVDREITVNKWFRSYEPFRYAADRLVVKEILHDPGKRLEVGRTIEVAPGDLAEQYAGHVVYVVDDVIESPIVMSYRGSFDASDATSERIALLRFGSFQGSPIAAYSVSGAVEGMERRAEIEALIRAIPR